MPLCSDACAVHGPCDLRPLYLLLSACVNSDNILSIDTCI